MAEEEFSVVVADNGSGTCNTEFAGDDAPRVELPSIIDRPKMPGIMVDTEQRTAMMLGYVLHIQDHDLRVKPWICVRQPTVILRVSSSK